MSLAGGALRLPKPLRGLGGWLGLALVITSGFFLDGAKLFPGPWALWPLLGLTLVLISAGPSGGNNDPKHTVTRLLSNKYLAWIGDHAYSLYLWHWPLLIFYLQIRSREAIGIRGAVVILAVTVVLAMLMYRYVETPLQRLSREQPVGLHRLNRVTVIAGASTLVIAGVTASSFAQPPQHIDTVFADLDPAIYPGASQYFMSETVPFAEPFPAPAEAGDFKQDYLARECSQAMGEKPGSDEITICEDEGAPENPTATIVLAGGSHAGHYEAAFKALARKYDWEVLIVIKSACLFGWEEHPNQTMCGQWNENFIDWLDENEVDLVVTPGSRQDDTRDAEYIVDAAPDWWQRVSDMGLALKSGHLR